MKKSVCFYHRADLDGKCAAAIVHLARPDVELVGVNYGDDFDSLLAGLGRGDEAIIVDFTFANGHDFHWMLDLEDRGVSIVWCDHHKTAIDLAAKYPSFRVPGRRQVGKAGCELTWEWFHPRTAHLPFSSAVNGEAPLPGTLASCFGVEDDPMPEAVWLLGRYDVWDMGNDDGQTWARRILPFQYGLRSHVTDPGAAIWAQLLMPVHPEHVDRSVEELIGEGNAILRYVTQQNDIRARACAFETEVGGLKVVAINVALANSQAFETVYKPERHHAMLAFAWHKTKWRCSLYSTRPDVDCGKVAQMLGGGGHKGAAGFECAVLPFSIGA